ncbi:Rv3654c family TadE-like protein [Streptomyces aidingensis]|uniref:Helicase/secretion neighborhood TadE-like protein n=1 Tax=Streptomyces aidingensis TaxID=910347 RepID=A0A1I1KJ65_9ACTN|nr:Rv3654c family TadE-like protein [Streptomyces aidingensis]SFC60847.1 helicase/secretion neighborhood TadE-like protein [Streptomyces aidingensis]
MPNSRDLRDRGSGTVWTVACVGVLCAAFAGVLALGQVATVRQRAATAADLAVLAAAERAFSGRAAGTPAAACSRAGEVAAAQGARLVRCAVPGAGLADLTVEVRAGPYRVVARSRAAVP